VLLAIRVRLDDLWLVLKMTGGLILRLGLKLEKWFRIVLKLMLVDTGRN
jgi:hypothetical protein